MNYFFCYIMTVLIIAAASQAHAAIKVLSVNGTAAYKDDKSWVPLRNGMILKDGTKVSTSVKSTAEIQIDDNIVTVQPLTMMKIQGSKSTADSSSTSIGLKRGSLRANVNREKRIKTVFKVSTPIATSSVRGTEKIVSHGPMRGTRIIMISGNSEGENKHGGKRSVSGKQVFQQHGNRPGPENVLAAVQSNSLGSIFSKNLTENEQANIQNNGSDLINSDNNALNIVNSVTGGSGTNKTNVKITVGWP